MEGRKGFACLVGMILSVSGCAPYSRTSTSPSAGTEASIEVDGGQRLGTLVAYAERVRGFTGAALATERAAAHEAHRRESNAYTRIKLAILLSHPRAPFRDDDRARELLRRTAADATAGAAPFRGLAGLLLRELNQRIALERALAHERGERIALQEKLEQLKTIEQEIDRRDAPATVPRTP